MAGKFDPYAEWLNITDTHRPLTNYQLLGLNRFESDASAIERSAEQQRAKLIPLFAGEHSQLAKRVAFEIESAKTCLLDPATKATYDAGLRSRELGLPKGRAADRSKAALAHPNLAMRSTCPVPTKPSAPAVKPQPENSQRQLSTWPPEGDRSTSTFRTKRNRYRMWLSASMLPISALIVTLLLVLLPRPREGNRRVPPATEPAKRPLAQAQVLRKSAPKSHPTSEPAVTKNKAIVRPSASRPTGQQKQKPKHSEHHDLAAKRPNRSKAPIQPRSTSGWTEISLPSGAMLTDSMFNAPANWQKTLFPEGANVFVAKYPNASIRDVCIVTNKGKDKGKLSGAAATLHENGRLRILAMSYLHGRLDGCLRQWSADGKRMLYAQYQNGKKHGLLCFFRDGLPCLIQECDKGKAQKEYLVRWTQDSPNILQVASLAGDEAAEASRAHRDLATLEETMYKGETELKADAVNFYHEEENRIRKARFAAVSAQQRAAASERMRARNAANAEAVNSLWRSALGRSGF
jgi:antitoxin component YwqK of YwqJK toxin-antitoxin module